MVVCWVGTAELSASVQTKVYGACYRSLVTIHVTCIRYYGQVVAVRSV